MNLIQKLEQKELIVPPPWLSNNTHYIVLMGSVAYGVSNEVSDKDIYGFCLPAIKYVFPHTHGYIQGFDSIPNFNQYQQHDIQDKDSRYDITIYSIVKYFKLCMDNNPNMIDSLFVPRHCVLHSTELGNMVRDNRHMFLHKGCWHKFKGYAYSQLSKMERNPTGKRKAVVEEYGYDVKYAYHILRLLDEVEQILTVGDLDLTRNAEQLKAVRRGEWTKEKIIYWFGSKEKELEEAYGKSKLPYGPPHDKIRNLLLTCLEHHYGSMDNLIRHDESLDREKLNKIKDILDEGKY